MSANTGASWSAQFLNAYDDMLSGPEALSILSRLNNVRTSATLTVKGGDREVSVGRGRCSGDVFNLSNLLYKSFSWSGKDGLAL